MELDKGLNGLVSSDRKPKGLVASNKGVMYLVALGKKAEVGSRSLPPESL